MSQEPAGEKRGVRTPTVTIVTGEAIACQLGGWYSGWARAVSWEQPFDFLVAVVFRPPGSADAARASRPSELIGFYWGQTHPAGRWGAAGMGREGFDQVHGLLTGGTADDTGGHHWHWGSGGCGGEGRGQM